MLKLDNMRRRTQNSLALQHSQDTVPLAPLFKEQPTGAAAVGTLPPPNTFPATWAAVKHVGARRGIACAQLSQLTFTYLDVPRPTAGTHYSPCVPQFMYAAHPCTTERAGRLLWRTVRAKLRRCVPCAALQDRWACLDRLRAPTPANLVHAPGCGCCATQA